MNTKENIDVRDAIVAHLKADDRSLMWLSEKTGINYNTIYSTFTQKVIRLTDEKLVKINEILGTDFK